MATTQTVQGIETFDIAGYSTSEIARQWLSGFGLEVQNAISEDSDVVNENGTVIAEVLNRAESDMWAHLRSEFGAFGFDQEAEEAVAEMVNDYRENGTLAQVIEDAKNRA